MQGNGPAAVLSNLVQDGTLTQAQADKVGEAFKARRLESSNDKRIARRWLPSSPRRSGSQSGLQKARQEGKTLADVAGDKHGEPISAMVAFVNSQIDRAVTDGKLTQEQADKIKPDVQRRVADRVDGNARGGPGMRPGGFESEPAA